MIPSMNDDAASASRASTSCAVATASRVPGPPKGQSNV